MCKCVRSCVPAWVHPVPGGPDCVGSQQGSLDPAQTEEVFGGSCPCLPASVVKPVAQLLILLERHIGAHGTCHWGPAPLVRPGTGVPSKGGQSPSWVWDPSLCTQAETRTRAFWPCICRELPPPVSRSITILS